MTQYGIATPKTDQQKAAMDQKIGRNHFFFQGDPTECNVTTAQGDVPALRWDFIQLDPIMRIALVLEFSRENNISIKAADQFLTDSGAYFVQADFELSYTDEQPEEWVTVYQRGG